MFSKAKLLQYIQTLSQRTQNQQVLKKKLATVEVFINWLKARNLINASDLHNISTHLELLKKDKNTIEGHGIEGSTKPSILGLVPQYKHILYLGCKVLLVVTLILFGYLLLSRTKQRPSQVFASKNNGRILNYRGVLRDQNGNPIDYKTDVVFKLYDTINSSAPLYAGTCMGEYGLEPKYNGSVSVNIGSDCEMKKIPDEIFTQYNDLYLGITIGSDVEMFPRQRIPKVSYSLQADELKGFTLGTQTNSIPYIDEQGVLLVNAASPTIRTTSGNFSLEGEMITIKTSEEKQGSIILNPAQNTIFSTGNVGLGIFNPTVKLEVGGDASISGSLTFSSKYSAINLLNGSDLVFNSSQQSDLTLTPQVIITNEGGLGIGTITPSHPLTVVKSAPGKAVSSLTNSATADNSEVNVLDLHLKSDSRLTSPHFVKFYAQNSLKDGSSLMGKIRLNNGGVAYETAGADFAEYFVTEEDVEQGDIVAMGQRGVKKAKDGAGTIGVVSDTAGFVGNSRQLGSDTTVVGLLGQVSTRISTLNGSINVGDIITSSVIPGYGAKSKGKGRGVGIALAGSAELVNEKCPAESRGMVDPQGNPVRCGKIVVMVQPSWYDNPLVFSDQPVQSSRGEVSSGLLSGAKLILAQVDSTLLKAVEASISVLRSEKIIAPVIHTQQLTSQEIVTSEIKPEEDTLLIDLSGSQNTGASSPFAELAIKGLEDRVVASIDSIGNASFSGEITSQSIQTQTVTAQKITSGKIESKEASISGHLYADEVRSQNISNLENSVTNLQNNLTASSSQISRIHMSNEELAASLSQIQTEIHNLSLKTDANPEYYQKLQELEELHTNSIAKQEKEYDSLQISGVTNMYDASVLNKFTIGNLVMTDNSILSLSWDLNINSLANVNFFDGAVIVSKDGTLVTSGEIIANKGIKTPQIEAKESELRLKINERTNPGDNEKFTFVNSDNEEVASIDNDGRAVFNQITLKNTISTPLQVITPADNFQKNGVYAHALMTDENQAGIGVIPQNTNEILIYNSNITDKSLIYITPTSVPIPLAVLEKNICTEKELPVGCHSYFKVATEASVPSDIQFNWLVIN